MEQYSFKYMATTALAAVAMMFVTTLTFFFWKGTPTWSAVYALIPVLLLGIGILSGKTEVNSKAPAYLYIFEIIFPYIWVGVCSMLGILPMHTIICFLTIAVGLGCATTMKKSIGQGDLLLKDLRSRTISLYMTFSVLLSISLAIAKFI